MWAGSGDAWSALPIRQSAYVNMPNDQVDWAALAKQWISERDAGLESTEDLSTMPIEQPTKSDLTQSQPQQAAPAARSAAPGMISSTVENNSSWTWSGMGGWQMPNWALVPPPPPPPPTGDIVNESAGIQNVLYEHEVFGSEVNYNVMGGEQHFSADQVSSSYNQSYFPLGHGNYWGGVSAEFDTTNFIPTGGHGHSYLLNAAQGQRVASGFSNTNAFTADSGIDAAKRRNLPAWIREGLEKMEREKHRQLERETTFKRKDNSSEAEDDLEDAEMKDMTADIIAPNQGGNGTQEIRRPEKPVRQSRFDITLEENEGVLKETSPSEFKEKETRMMTEEETQANLILNVRLMLTEVLLDVTNREIKDIAYSTYQRAKQKAAKAPAKQLAKSSALASISAFGVSYGSDESEEDANLNSGSDKHSDSDDDDVVQRKIRQKRQEFERKMKDLEEQEQEDERREYGTEVQRPRDLDEQRSLPAKEQTRQDKELDEHKTPEERRVQLHVKGGNSSSKEIAVNKRPISITSESSKRRRVVAKNINDQKDSQERFDQSRLQSASSAGKPAVVNESCTNSSSEVEFKKIGQGSESESPLSTASDTDTSSSDSEVSASESSSERVSRVAHRQENKSDSRSKNAQVQNRERQSATDHKKEAKVNVIRANSKDSEIGSKKSTSKETYANRDKHSSDNRRDSDRKGSKSGNREGKSNMLDERENRKQEPTSSRSRNTDDFSDKKLRKRTSSKEPVDIKDHRRTKMNSSGKSEHSDHESDSLHKAKACVEVSKGKSDLRLEPSYSSSSAHGERMARKRRKSRSSAEEDEKPLRKERESSKLNKDHNGMSRKNRRKEKERSESRRTASDERSATAHGNKKASRKHKSRSRSRSKSSKS